MVTNRFYLGDKASSAGGARTRWLTNLYCHCLRQCHSLCGNNDIPVTLSASAIIVVLCALTSLLIASSEPHQSSAICSDAVHFFRHINFSHCPAMRICPPLSPLDFPLSARIAASSATAVPDNLRQCNNDCFACGDDSVPNRSARRQSFFLMSATAV